MLANFAFFFGGSRDNNNPFGFVGMLVAAIVAPLAAMLVQMAMSRTREYAADRMRRRDLRPAAWLASALGKISPRRRAASTTATAERNPATAHLFIVNPLSGARMDNLFSTHPATENRIAALCCHGGRRRPSAPRSRLPCPAWPPPGAFSAAPAAPGGERPLPLCDRQSRRPPEPRPGVAARTVAPPCPLSSMRSQPFDASHRSGGRRCRLSSALPPRDRRPRPRHRRHRASPARARSTAILGRPHRAKPPRRSGPLPRILDIAAAQILFMDVPDHAAVSVARRQVVADRDARHFKGLANAVLRRLVRERETILAGLDAAPSRSRPTGCGSAGATQLWRGDAARGSPRPISPSRRLDLTVKSDPAGWAERLGGIVLPTGSVRLVPSGPGRGAARLSPRRLVGAGRRRRPAREASRPRRRQARRRSLRRPRRQDRATRRGGRPGHRRRHLARSAFAGCATISSALNFAAEIVAADLLHWSPADLFDAVLLDAPCSSTGTIRRHPDIARLKRADDIAAHRRPPGAACSTGPSLS